MKGGCNAGCGYHFDWLPLSPPPPPGHPETFASTCVRSPRAFAQQKMPGAGPINEDIPRVGFLISWLSNMKIVNTVISA